MKKFSVLFVAMLIALTLFVGCENKPKERPAKAEDMEVFGLLSNAAYNLAFSNAEGVDPTITKNKISVVFTNAKYKANNVIIILNGTFVAEGSEQSGKMKLDLTSGTSINGKGYTLYAEGSSDGVLEIILDGYRLTGLDKLFASSQPGQNESPSGNPGQNESPSGNPGQNESPSGNPGQNESPSGNPGQSGSSSDYMDIFNSISDAIGKEESWGNLQNVNVVTTASKMIISFNHAEVRTENGTVILNGTYEINTTNGSFIINMTSGTSINGKGHTLYVKGSSYGNDIEVIIDGEKVTLY